MEWATNGPTEAEYVVAVSIDDNEGKIVYAVGAIPEHLYPHYVWQTEDGGKSWKYVGLITDPEINFKDKEEIYDWIMRATHGFSFSSTNMCCGGYPPKYDPPHEDPKKADPNAQITLQPVCFDPFPTENDPPFEEWALCLSFDGGESWLKVNLPPPYDYESGEQTVANFTIFWYDYDLISANGALKIFFAKKEVWQAEISLPK